MSGLGLRAPIGAARLRRRIALIVAPALVLAGLGVVSQPARAHHGSGSTIEQHWELLDQTKLGMVSTTTIPIHRGVIPGGTTKFDPAPTVTFEVALKTTTGTGQWMIELRDNTSVIASIGPITTANGYTLRTAGFTWPSSDRSLTSIRVVQSLGGTRVLDIRKAYLKIKQTGTIKKTVGRLPVATRQNVSNIGFEDVTPLIHYTHAAADFDPAPTIQLRATTQLNSGVFGQFRLVDDDKAVPSGAYKIFSNTNIASVSTDPITLSDATRYRMQVDVQSSGHLTPNWELYSADLVFEQSTTDPHGIAKTVGWYPSVTDPTDIAANGTMLGFLSRTPLPVVEDLFAKYETNLTRLTGTNQFGVELASSPSSTALASPVAVGGEGTIDATIGVRKGLALPSSVTTLDARTVLGSGSTGRVTTSVLRVAMTLHDLVPPISMGFEAYPNPFAPESAAPRNVATIRATLLESLPWTVTVKKPDDTLVRSFTGTGTDVSATWDGKDGLGVRVPDGAYKIGLEATDAAGNALATTRWLTLGPAPTILSVTTQPQIGDLITITGTNFGPGLGHFGVTVNYEDTIIQSWSDTQITTWLPSTLDPGSASVAVWAADLTGAPYEIEVSKVVSPPIGDPIVEGEIRVRLPEGSDPEALAVRLGDPPTAITLAYPGTTSDRLDDWYRVITSVGNERTRAVAYAGDSVVEVAQVSSVGAAPIDPPDDEEWGSQWALNGAYGINILRAWEHTRGDPSVVIGLLDSGISHADLVTNLHSQSVSDNACGHGTLTAGAAAADTNNDKNIAGVGYNTRIRAYRIWSTNGTTGQCTSLGNLAAKTDEARTDGVDVMIFGIASTAPDVDVREAVEDAYEAGVLLVAAAGNHSGGCVANPCWPAAFPQVISVGGHTKQGGASDSSNAAEFVEIYAPGKEVRALKQTGGTGDVTGTSIASPHAAGVGALLLSLDGMLSVTARMSMVRNLDGGLGRLDAGKALANRIQRQYPNGTWVRREGGTQAYLIVDDVARPAASQVLDSWGVTDAQLVELHPAELNTFRDGNKFGPPIGFRPGTLIATSDSLSLLSYTTGTTHTISNENAAGGQVNRWLHGERYELGPVAFACLGYDANRIKVVAQNLFDLHQRSSNQDPDNGWTDCLHHPPGAILVDGAGQRWMLYGSTRRLFKDDSVIESWGAADDVTSATPTEFDVPITEGTKLGYRIGTALFIPDQRWVIVPRSVDWGAGAKRNFRGNYDCYEYRGSTIPEQNSYVNELHSPSTDGPDMPC